MLSITKKFDFCYGHHLPDHKGKCRHQHGHNSVLEVELIPTNITSQLCDYDGMIIDFGDMKRLVNETVIDKLDHQYLNNLIPIPTAENLVMWIVQGLRNVFGSSLQRVRIYETPTSYAEWRAGHPD